jgi:peptide/nickel transport system permease protein
MTRAGMIRELESDYARTATMKGLSRQRVVLRHVVPNALLPAITVVGAQLGAIVGSLVIIESLFDYPGIGDLILTAATGHDVLVLEGAVLVVALVYLTANLLADLTYGLLDPRIRRGRD